MRGCSREDRSWSESSVEGCGDAQVLLSIVIPAYNEEKNLPHCIAELRGVLREQQIPYEIIVVNDNSTDGTRDVIAQEMLQDPAVRTVDRRPPGGFGRAVRSGLEAIQGDVVVIYMADRSDDPNDVLKYYRKIVDEGYDCVFGSRFIRGSKVENYPKLKLVVNRIVNIGIKCMFWSKFNDFTNAFKGYRTEVIRACGPYRASHFNLTLELSLNALIRQEMGRRYISTLLMVYFQKAFVRDDLIAEKLSARVSATNEMTGLRDRLARVEQALASLKAMEGNPRTSQPADWPEPDAVSGGQVGSAPQTIEQPMIPVRG